LNSGRFNFISKPDYMKQLIFAIVIALLAVVFALQNTVPVTVNLFFWDVTMSLALLVTLLLITGMLVGLLIMSKTVYNKNTQLRSMQKQQNSTIQNKY